MYPYQDDLSAVGVSCVAGRRVVVWAGSLFQGEPVGLYLVGVLGSGSIGGVAAGVGLAA